MKIFAIGVEITSNDINEICNGESRIITTLLNNETVTSLAEMAGDILKKKAERGGNQDLPA